MRTSFSLFTLVVLAISLTPCFTRAQGLTAVERMPLELPGDAARSHVGRAVAFTPDGQRSFVGTDHGVLVFSRAAGGTWAEEDLLEPSDGQWDDSFGAAIAISADGMRAVVGAPARRSGSSSAQGAAYVFVHAAAGWVQEQTLTSTGGGGFGTAVAIDASGSRIVVGAPRGPAPLGGTTVMGGDARVFVRSGGRWSFEAALTLPGGFTGDAFGSALAMSGDGARVAIGAPGVGASDAGAAAIFGRTGTTWAYETALTPGTGGSATGSAIALSTDGGRLIIGAPGTGTSDGVAYVFVRSDGLWGAATALSPSRTQQGFGASVAFDGTATRAVVGERGGRGAGASRNSLAEVFLRTGESWASERSFALSAMTGDLDVLSSVALTSDAAFFAVGSPGHETEHGSVQIVARSGTTWTSAMTFDGRDERHNEHFATRMALSRDGTRLAVLRASSGTPTAAHVFVRSGDAWLPEGVLGSLPPFADDDPRPSLAIDGTGARVFVGDPRDGSSGVRVYVRTGTSWSEEFLLTPSDLAAGDWFGFSVATNIAGDRVFVGAPADDDGSAGIPGTNVGTVRIFERSGHTWSQVPYRFVSGSMNVYSGTSVACNDDGTRFVVGMPHINPLSPFGGGAGGQAEVASRSAAGTWSVIADIRGPSLGSDVFGAAVAMDAAGSRVAVGAPQESTDVTTGVVHVYRIEPGVVGWASEAELSAPDRFGGERFGASVAFLPDATKLLVGAPGRRGGAGPDVGAGYVFTRSGTSWALATGVFPAGGQAADHAGESVAFDASGTLVLVGAPLDDTVAGHDAGSVRIAELMTTSLMPLGAACTTASTCASSFCVDGVCCDGACGAGATNDCLACTRTLTGGPTGMCGSVQRDARVVCRDAAAPCDAPEMCDGTNECPVDVLASDGALCSDGNPCNGDETCRAGACTGPGAPLDCDDGNLCTTDSCDVSVGCVNTAIGACGMGDAGIVPVADAGMSAERDAGVAPASDAGVVPRSDGGGARVDAGGASARDADVSAIDGGHPVPDGGSSGCACTVARPGNEAGALGGTFAATVFALGALGARSRRRRR